MSFQVNQSIGHGLCGIGLVQARSVRNETGGIALHGAGGFEPSVNGLS